MLEAEGNDEPYESPEADWPVLKLQIVNRPFYCMQWTEEQQELVKTYRKLEDIPVAKRQYKCHTCHLIVDETPCPQCGEEHLVILCPLDHCHCSHEITSGIEYCPLCGEPVCPDCGSHDVVQISRVTGYLQEVSGWNAGKQQELKDRMRYTVA
jgi:hypothetical protein